MFIRSKICKKYCAHERVITKYIHITEKIEIRWPFGCYFLFFIYFVMYAFLVLENFGEVLLQQCHRELNWILAEKTNSLCLQCTINNLNNMMETKTFVADVHFKPKPTNTHARTHTLWILISSMFISFNELKFDFLFFFHY